jgi:O-antigen ligase
VKGLTREHAVGLAIAGALVVWVLFSGLVNDRAPWRMAGAVLLAVAAYGAGRLARLRIGRRAAPLGVAFLGGAVLLVSSPSDPLSLPATGFLGYSNANGSFFMLAAFAALLAMAAARSTTERLALAAALIVFATIPFQIHARAATYVSILLLPGLWIVLGRRGHRPILLVTGLLVIATVALTFFLAREHTKRFVARRDYREAAGLYGRAHLWADGYRIFADNALIGVGPGGFQETSFLASDEDVRWVHNEFLQIAAETGMPGLILLLGMLAWGLWALARPPTEASVAAALAITAFSLNASTDYLLHIPILPAMLAAMAGSAMPVGSRAAGKRVARRS